ncbi:MAG: S-layer homology domain-containing protein, partial [Candidatus Limnocylindrales bacterium]
MGQPVSRRGAIKLMVLSVVVALAVAVPASVWASHQFFDVPNSNPFHKEISALSDAGITTGFGDGGFHPGAAVTRQAMAAFLGRGLGRITSNTTAAGTSDPVGIGASPTLLTTVAMDSGAEGNGSAGFVWLTGVAQIISTSPVACPCHVELSIWDSGSNTQLGVAKVDVPGAANEYGSSVAAVSVSAVAVLGGEATGLYQLKATRFDTSTALQGTGSLTA